MHAFQSFTRCCLENYCKSMADVICQKIKWFGRGNERIGIRPMVWTCSLSLIPKEYGSASNCTRWKQKGILYLLRHLMWMSTRMDNVWATSIPCSRKQLDWGGRQKTLSTSKRITNLANPFWINFTRITGLMVGSIRSRGPHFKWKCASLIPVCWSTQSLQTNWTLECPFFLVLARSNWQATSERLNSKRL